MRSIGGNDIGAIVTALLSIFYLFVNRKYPIKGEFGYSAGFYPLILGIVLLGLSIVWFMSNRAIKKKVPLSQLVPAKGPVLVVLMLIVSTALFNLLGTILSMMLLAGLIWYFYEKLPLRFTLTASLILSLLMYVIFRYGLAVPVPKGLIGFL